MTLVRCDIPVHQEEYEKEIHHPRLYTVSTMCPEFKHYREGRFHVKILTEINRIRKGRSDNGGPHQSQGERGPQSTHTLVCLPIPTPQWSV